MPQPLIHDDHRAPTVRTNADCTAPLSASWTGSLGQQLKLPAALILLGILALAIDVPLSRKLVRDDALLFLDKALEAVEPFGHAVTVVLLIGGIFVCDLKRRRALPRVLASALGAGIAADLVKLCVSRVRPYDYDLAGGVFDSFRGWLPGLLGPRAGGSFPSAHVATAAGLAVALCTLFPRGRWWFIMVTGLVALQRVETGAHFLSDACWGAAVGYTFALLLFRPGLISSWFDRWEAATGRERADAPPQHAVATNGLARTEQLASAPAGAILSVRPRSLPEPEPVSSLSLVVPIYNECENIPRMYEALQPVLAQLPLEYEIIFVDDGSQDGSAEQLQCLAARDSRVRVVTFRRNFGQTAAMNAGMHLATGDAVVLLDGDLQNDPADIPMMLGKLAEGYDLVHGWRRDRQDRFIDRRLPSIIANWVISKVTGFPIHDLGCTLKVLRRDIAHDLNLYGEMHRFIPVLAHCRGARCAEVVTRHHARQYGTSKYGISRTLRVILDLVTVQFLTRYLVSPMKLFGKLGVAGVLLGCACGASTVLMKLLQGTDMTGNPLLLASAFAMLLGTQFFCLGVLGEVASRTYFESQDRASYAIRKLTNFNKGAPQSKAA